MNDENELLRSVFRQLETRDNFEKKDSDLFTAFVELSRLSGAKVAEDSVGGEEIDIIKKKNGRLQNENDWLIRSLNEKRLALDKLETTIQRLQQRIEEFEKQNKKLEAKLEHSNLEIKEKNKTIEIINDEVLLNRIQTNVLNEELKRLRHENESLIKRWKERSQREIEKLNSFNELHDILQNEKPSN